MVLVQEGMISPQHDAEVHGLDNCVFLGELVPGGLQWLQRLLRSSAAPPCSVARNQAGSDGGWSGGVHPLGYRYQLHVPVYWQSPVSDKWWWVLGPAAGSGPTAGSLVAVGPLAVDVCSCGCRVSPQVHTQLLMGVGPVRCRYTAWRG